MLTPLPPAIAAALWRGVSLARPAGRTLPSGHGPLDAQLPGGGWPLGAITEVLQTQPGLAEWRLIGAALAAQGGSAGTVLVIGPPLHPHVPGLRQLGLGERPLVWVDVQRQNERLWAIEQALKANSVGAVVAWLPQARPEHLRRLQVCAQRCEAPVWLFRPLAARQEPSAAPLRLIVRAQAGSTALSLQIIKRRGVAHEGLITLTTLPAAVHRVLAHRQARAEPLIEENTHAVLDGVVPAAVLGHAHG